MSRQSLVFWGFVKTFLRFRSWDNSNVSICSHLTKFDNGNQKSLTYKTRNTRENVVSFSGCNERDNDLINDLISPCYSPFHAEFRDIWYVVLRTLALCEHPFQRFGIPFYKGRDVNFLSIYFSFANVQGVFKGNFMYWVQCRDLQNHSQLTL